MIKTIHWLSAFAIAVILIGSVSIGTIAFADDDDDKKKKKIKSLNPVYMRIFSDMSGELFCPNGVDKIPSSDMRIALSFSEEAITQKGTTSIGAVFLPHPFAVYEGTLYNGKINSKEFRVTGLGSPNDTLQNLCGEPAILLDTFTIWGKCGVDATIKFESESGYRGTFTDKVACL